MGYSSEALSRRRRGSPASQSFDRDLLSLNPTATLLEHASLTQGFMGTSKSAFPRRLRPQNRDSTWAILGNALKCRCRVKSGATQSQGGLGGRTRRTLIVSFFAVGESFQFWNPLASAMGRKNWWLRSQPPPFLLTRA